MYSNDQLCFSCSNACGGCSWSSKFIPVENWDAVKTVTSNGVDSYKIIKCPEYIFDGTCVRCVSFNENYDKPEEWYKVCPNFIGTQGYGDCFRYINKYKVELDNEKYEL